MTDTILTISPLEFSRLSVFKSVSMVDVEPILLNCPLLRIEQGTVIISAGQPLERIATDTDRDNFMGGEEAQEYGIIDAVLDSRAAEPAA